MDMKFGEAPGNVVLRKGEANMPKACVVNATQIKSVDRSSLRAMIGAFSRKRMDEVEAGIRLVMDLNGGTFH
jgi:mRNA interferase MazF